MAHQSPEETSSDMLERVQKRRRKIPLACGYCRSRKTRCDGRQPACWPCERRGRPEDCSYDPSSLNTQRYVSSLERRVKEQEKELEKANTQLRQMSEGSPHPSPALSLPPGIGNSNGGFSHLSPSVTHMTPPSSTRQPYSGEGQKHRQTTSGIDGLATFPSNHEDMDSMFGNSSTIAFVRHISGTVDGAPTDSSNAMVQRSDQTGAESGGNPGMSYPPLSPTSVVLPSRHAADNFTSAYFNIVHPLFPIIHQPSFDASYRYLWQPPDADQPLSMASVITDPIFMSTVNVVFALGCQFSDMVEPSRRTRVAAEFYDRSMQLSAFRVLDAASLESVQLLLLTGVYLQSTQYASRCWNMVGLAIRAAQALGLHLESKHSSCASQLRREMGRRVWYNCVVLDRLQAMTFGRPLMILHPSHVKYPQLIDDEYLLDEGEGSQPASHESRLGFFVETIKLFDILDDILSTVYLKDSEVDSQPGQQNISFAIMRLNSDLDTFFADLPPHLRPAHGQDWPGISRDSCFSLQANVLYTRFLYTRTLLLRPLLQSAKKRLTDHNPQNPYQTTSLEQHMTIKACALCSKTAQTLIDSLFDHLHSVFRCSGWYTVYFTFAAATVLLGVRLLDIPDTTPNEAEFHTSWDRAMSILRYHEPQIQSAHRAVQILESLMRQINDFKTRGVASQQLQGEQEDFFSFALPLYNHDGFDSLSTSWFTQQITNLDFLDVI